MTIFNSLFNGRNRLEKLLRYLSILTAANYLIEGFYSRLITWLNKYNYREYIKKIKKLYSPLKKVLLRLVSHEGSWYLIVWLVFGFLNLVKSFFYFLYAFSALKSTINGFYQKVNQLCVFVYLAHFSAIYKFQR